MLSDALGKGVRTVHPSLRVDATTEPLLHKARSSDLHDRRLVETALATEGVHHDIQEPGNESQSAVNRLDARVAMESEPAPGPPNQEHPRPKPSRINADDVISPGIAEIRRSESGEKGHAHDPLDAEPLFLGIGNGDPNSLDAPPSAIVAESPTAAEFNIYDAAYQEEVERIRAAQGRSATVYLTRRVDKKKEYKADANMVEAPRAEDIEGLPHQGFKNLVDKAREKSGEPDLKDKVLSGGNRFSDFAAHAIENTRALKKDIGDKGAGVTINAFLQKAVDSQRESTKDGDQKSEMARESGDT